MTDPGLNPPRYRRVLLKLSGEQLADDGQIISSKRLHVIGRAVKSVLDLNVQVALVIGGGNIWRGVAPSSTPRAPRPPGSEDPLATSSPTSRLPGLMALSATLPPVSDRPTGDYMGMLATTINALALQDVLETRFNFETRVQSAIEMHQICEPYIRRRAIRHLDQGRVVIFAAGTGNPFFTTDTAASLRAMEIGAGAIFKGTKVDGVYDKDPKKHADARKYSRVSYLDALNQGLGVMDATAISLCMDNKLPIIVFSMEEPDNFYKVVVSEDVGTYVGNCETAFARP